MTKQEKIVQGLTVCIPGECGREKCPYYEGPESEYWSNLDGYECEHRLRQDAIAQLKKQKPLDMTYLEHDAKVFYEEFSKLDNLLHEYCAFSCYIQDMLIVSPYVIDTGNFENVNKVVIDHLEWFRKKHPILWRIATYILSF